MINKHDILAMESPRRACTRPTVDHIWVLASDNPIHTTDGSQFVCQQLHKSQLWVDGVWGSKRHIALSQDSATHLSSENTDRQGDNPCSHFHHGRVGST